MRPNIVYLHSHDTGRHIQPYGHQVPTPNIQRLAEQGLLFRQAFSAAPVCSPSRAALLTGEYSHTNGMLGLAHRGYRLADSDHHLVHTLRTAGYTSTLIGEQHLSVDPQRPPHPGLHPGGRGQLGVGSDSDHDQDQLGGAAEVGLAGHGQLASVLVHGLQSDPADRPGLGRFLERLSRIDPAQLGA